MALSKERMGEVAMLMLQSKLEEEGITLKPREIRREVMNRTKRLGVSNYEVAQMAKIIIETAYQKVIAVLEEITPSTTTDTDVE